MARNILCWSFRWSHSGDSTFIHFTGEELRLDAANVATLAGELLHLGRHELCLNFRHVRCLDSYAVAMLRVLQKQLVAAGRAVRLADFGPALVDEAVSPSCPHVSFTPALR